MAITAYEIQQVLAMRDKVEAELISPAMQRVIADIAAAQQTAAKYVREVIESPTFARLNEDLALATEHLRKHTLTFQAVPKLLAQIESMREEPAELRLSPLLWDSMASPRLGRAVIAPVNPEEDEVSYPRTTGARPALTRLIGFNRPKE